VVESVVGPWAKEKLSCLAKYLEEYTKILRKQPGLAYIYVDAFSGFGTHRVRENRVRDTAQLDFTLLRNHLDEDSGHQEYLKGSPRVS
jgi:three-Cys-motif partner protein